MRTATPTLLAGRVARRILLVEDEPSLVTTLTDRLVAEGYEVEAVADGERALAHPAAEFGDSHLDVMLPAERIRRVPGLRQRASSPILC